MNRFGPLVVLLGAIPLLMLSGQGMATLLPIKKLVTAVLTPQPTPLPPLQPLPPLPALPVLGSQSGLPPPAGALVAEQVPVAAGGSSVVRHYLLHTPNRPSSVPTNEKLPLVLVLHGNNQSAQQMANTASGQVWRLMADGIIGDEIGPFYVAFLNGATPGNLASGPQAIGTWNDCDAERVNNLSTANDVAFAKAVVAQLESKINPSKVYAYGMSNGAMMALRLGREAGDVVAAVAAIAGVDPQPVNDECVETADGVPMRRPAAIVHGTADSLVPFANNCVTNSNLSGLLATICRLGHAETVAAWKSKSGAIFAADEQGLPPPTTTYPKSASPRPAPAPIDATRISCAQHLKGFDLSSLLERGLLVPASPSDVQIEDCVITGGGHLEPSILTYAGIAVEAAFGKQNNDAESAMLAWQFFRRHTK